MFVKIMMIRYHFDNVSLNMHKVYVLQKLQNMLPKKKLQNIAYINSE